jgi:hypothetical protein
MTCFDFSAAARFDALGSAHRISRMLCALRDLRKISGIVFATQGARDVNNSIQLSLTPMSA